jgi:predicted nucleic acid-binding protein
MIAFVDCSVLKSFYLLGILEFLPLLFDSIEVPYTVRDEFFSSPDEEEVQKRILYLDNATSNPRGWFRMCTAGDEGALQIARDGLQEEEKSLHGGEAEAMVQALQGQLAGNVVLLIDEKKGRKVASKKSVPIHGTLYVLAVLEKRHGKLDYQQACNTLQKHGQYFSKHAIAQVLSELHP